MTRCGVVPVDAIARSKNLRAATMSRVGDTLGVHDLAVSVDGAIDVVPASADASVRLVHPPVGTDRVAVCSRRLAKQRKEALHPAINDALIDQHAALGKPLAHFGVAQGGSAH